MWRRGGRVRKGVWGARFMRESQIRWGRWNLGFAWMFAELLLFAFPVLVMWSYLRSPFEHGLPLMPFIWSGYLPLLIFRHVTGHAIYAVRGRAPTPYHPAVTPLHLIAGRFCLHALRSPPATTPSHLLLYLPSA